MSIRRAQVEPGGDVSEHVHGVRRRPAAVLEAARVDARPHGGGGAARAAAAAAAAVLQPAAPATAADGGVPAEPSEPCANEVR